MVARSLQVHKVLFILLLFLFFFFFFFFFFCCTFYNCIVPLRFLPWEIQVAFPGENQPRQSRTTQSTVHAGFFSVSKIHRTLTWATGSLTCAQMEMFATAHGGVRTPWESLYWKLTLGEKIPCRTGKPNLRRQRAEPMLYQLSYIPTRDLCNQYSRPCRVLFSLTMRQNDWN